LRFVRLSFRLLPKADSQGSTRLREEKAIQQVRSIYEALHQQFGAFAFGNDEKFFFEREIFLRASAFFRFMLARVIDQYVSQRKY
jgi:hypothetical protein